MSRIARLAVVVTALMSLLAVMSSTTGAITWHNTGDMTLTATAGATTWSSTGTNGLTCPAGGTATGDATTNLTDTVAGLMHGTVKWHISEFTFKVTSGGASTMGPIITRTS